MILLDALYINNSGGKALLDYLVEELYRSGLPIFYLLDKRIEGAYPFLPEENCRYQEAGLYQRHIFYRRHHSEFDKVFCFGNIPPSLKLQVPVFTYFHNVLYLDTSEAFSFKNTLLLRLKSWVIRNLSANTDEWWVQSEEVRKTMMQHWPVGGECIKAMPFFPEPHLQNGVSRDPFSFLYVSEGHPYKQHLPLLEAFAMLHQDFPKPRLRLTVSERYPALIEKIGHYRKAGVPVENLGWISKEQLAREYTQNQYLVYPSLRESFGLGLIEAAQAGMCILAADLPYARAVIEPFLFFDPENAQGIYHSMKQALQFPPSPTPLKTSNAISRILNRLN